MPAWFTQLKWVQRLKTRFNKNHSKLPTTFQGIIREAEKETQKTRNKPNSRPHFWKTWFKRSLDDLHPTAQKAYQRFLETTHKSKFLYATGRSAFVLEYLANLIFKTKGPLHFQTIDTRDNDILFNPSRGGPDILFIGLHRVLFWGGGLITAYSAITKLLTLTLPNSWMLVAWPIMFIVLPALGWLSELYSWKKQQPNANQHDRSRTPQKNQAVTITKHIEQHINRAKEHVLGPQSPYQYWKDTCERMRDEYQLIKSYFSELINQNDHLEADVLARDKAQQSLERVQKCLTELEQVRKKIITMYGHMSARLPHIQKALTRRLMIERLNNLDKDLEQSETAIATIIAKSEQILEIEMMKLNRALENGTVHALALPLHIPKNDFTSAMSTLVAHEVSIDTCIKELQQDFEQIEMEAI